MKYLFAILLSALAFPAFAVCPDPLPDPATICLEWTQSMFHTDGRALTDLDGFDIYYGFSPGVTPQNAAGAIPVGAALRETTLEAGGDVVIAAPAGGGDVLVYFVMTSRDGSGNDSELSNEISEFAVFPDSEGPPAPRIIMLRIRIT